MVIAQLIDSEERDLGGFTVRRVLPAAGRQMVGPFIFFDHLSPTQFAAGTGIDVRPHPHIALATVTYLFSGSLEHRDSLGTARVILPGDVNWMTAGEGIAHSERTPASARKSGELVHGIQSWVALPDGAEDVAAAFVHYPASVLPTRTLGGVRLTMIAGEGFGMRSPVATLWRTVYAQAQFEPDAALDLAADAGERAIYVVEGAIGHADTQMHRGQLAVLEPGASISLRAIGATRIMLLGGDRFPTPRYLWWNFVASSPERIESAKQRWQRNDFPRVPGETEFIPLPPG